jgi:hypothetical protein
MPKGTTSKEAVETRSYDKKLFLMVKFPEFLGSPTYSGLALPVTHQH